MNNQQEWIQSNIHSGQRETLTFDEMVRMTSKLGITDAQALLRDHGKQCHTDHYEFRPVNDADRQRHVASMERSHQVQRLVWGSLYSR